MIHVFHGFMGSPLDFDFLQSKEPIRLHDLYQEESEKISIAEDDTLIGYSMGGRVAMEIAVHHEFRLRKLVIINAHPGLETATLKERSIWEESVLKRMARLTPEEFLTYWNTLPLFAADRPLQELSLEKYNKSAIIFNKYRLSRQKCFLPELEKHKEKVLWIAGLQDEKYAQIAREMIEPRGIPCVFIQGGHRLYQHRETLMNILKERSVL